MIGRLLAAVCLCASAPAAAAGVTGAERHDCDAPVDAYRSIPHSVTLPTATGGTITVRRMAPREYAPSISVAVIDADRTDGAGFQITAAADDARELEVTLIRRDASGDVETAEGHVPAGAAIPYRLSADAAGKVSMVVGGIAFEGTIAAEGAAEAASGIARSLVVTCTSGRFDVTATPVGPVQPPVNSR